MPDQPATISKLIREIEQTLGADQTAIVHPTADTAAITDRFPSLTIIASPHVLENEAIVINQRLMQEALDAELQRWASL